MVKYWDQLPFELRRPLQLEPADCCPTILLAGKRDETLDSLLGKKHLRRRRNKLEKAGGVNFRHIETQAEAQEQLTQFFQCHRRRCAVLGKNSDFEAPEMCRFVRALAEQLDLRNEMRFGVLEVSGRPVAWSLGFEANGKFLYYQQTFELDAAQYAPGEVLLYYLLLWAKENVEREFDFARGEEFFKSRFATVTVQNWNLHFERPGVRGWLRRFRRPAQGRFHRLEKRIEGALRNHEGAFHTLRSMRVWGKSVLSRGWQAKEKVALIDYLLASGANLFRSAIWARQEITLFQMVRGAELETLAQDPRADQETEITTAGFSDLVDLSLEHPGVLPARLSEYRDRLKKGDRAYVVREKNRVALLAWTGTREVSDLLILKDCRITAGAPAMTMYECWTVPPVDPAGSYHQILSFLMGEALDRNMHLLVCCTRSQPSLQLELDRQGFHPKYRMVRYRVFYWIRRDSVRDLPVVGGKDSVDRI